MPGRQRISDACQMSESYGTRFSQVHSPPCGGGLRGRGTVGVDGTEIYSRGAFLSAPESCNAKQELPAPISEGSGAPKGASSYGRACEARQRALRRRQVYAVC